MCVCVCVCVCVYIYIYIYIYSVLCVCVCVWIDIYIYIYILSLRCLLGIHIGIKTYTESLLVVIQYGEYKSLSTVPDIIICMRSENILLYETRISSVQSLSHVRLFLIP